MLDHPDRGSSRTAVTIMRWCKMYKPNSIGYLISTASKLYFTLVHLFSLSSLVPSAPRSDRLASGHGADETRVT